MTDDWVDVADLAALRIGRAKVVEIDGVPVAVVRTGDTDVHAIMNVCPHRGGPVGEGDVEGTVVTCPWHAWSFDLRTGAMTRNPAVKVRTFECRVSGGRVSVRRP